MGVQDVRWGREGTVRAGDYNFFLWKRSKYPWNGGPHRNDQLSLPPSWGLSSQHSWRSSITVPDSSSGSPNAVVTSRSSSVLSNMTIEYFPDINHIQIYKSFSLTFTAWHEDILISCCLLRDQRKSLTASDQSFFQRPFNAVGSGSSMTSFTFI